MKVFTITTTRQVALIDITDSVRQAVAESGVRSGLATIFVPHTTAGVTINENADPAVLADLMADLDRILPLAQEYYRHAEGNSAAHIKSSLIGSSQTVFVEDARLFLGTWQGIYFCEFDGPRTRRFCVKVT